MNPHESIFPLFQARFLPTDSQMRSSRRGEKVWRGSWVLLLVILSYRLDTSFAHLTLLTCCHFRLGARCFAPFCRTPPGISPNGYEEFDRNFLGNIRLRCIVPCNIRRRFANVLPLVSSRRTTQSSFISGHFLDTFIVNSSSLFLCSMKPSSYQLIL